MGAEHLISTTQPAPDDGGLLWLPSPVSHGALDTTEHKRAENGTISCSLCCLLVLESPEHFLIPKSAVKYQ